ncbi:M23 family metallopeptidase [Candidatus Riflebacteria bacterium]
MKRLLLILLFLVIFTCSTIAKGYFFPLEGDWVVFKEKPGGPGLNLYAVRLELEKKEYFFRLSKNFLRNQRLKNHHFHGFKKEVRAIEDGWVEEVQDFVQENHVDHPNITPGFSRGNYIVIQQIDGVRVTYSSLAFGSICVKKGLYVRKGNRLGLTGNSGNNLLPGLCLEAKKRGKDTSLIFKNIAVRYKGYAKEREVEKEFLRDIFYKSGVLAPGEVVAHQHPRLDPHAIVSESKLR